MQKRLVLVSSYGNLHPFFSYNWFNNHFSKLSQRSTASRIEYFWPNPMLSQQSTASKLNCFWPNPKLSQQSTASRINYFWPNPNQKLTASGLNISDPIQSCLNNQHLHWSSRFTRFHLFCSAFLNNQQLHKFWSSSLTNNIVLIQSKTFLDIISQLHNSNFSFKPNNPQALQTILFF